LNRAWRRLAEFIRHVKERDSIGLAAKTAFFFLIALFPLLIMVGWVLEIAQIPMGELEGLLPMGFMGLFEQERGAAALPMRGPVPALLTLWGASAGVWSLMKGVNKAYSGNRLSSPKARIMAIVFTVGFLAALFWTLIAISREAKALTVPASTFMLLFALYAYTPGMRPRLARSFCTALAVSICWVALSLGFEWYMRYFSNYNALYGSLGAFLGLSLWVFAICAVIILGAEIGAFCSRHNS